MAKKRAFLVLADGTVFEGYSEGADGMAVGELVFNTSMTGYQEILSDPSYANQIVTLTASHIGNTGCNKEDMESTKAWATGLVMRQCTADPSNYRSESSLSLWLKKQHVVAISGVDTRAITLKLRDMGATPACITSDAANLDEALAKAKAFEGLQGADLASVVSRKTIERWHEGRGEWASKTEPQKLHVVAYDFGVKHQMLRILHDAGCHITLVPAKTSAEEVISLKPDGILLSNGPGDPEACDYAINATRTFLDKSIPVFGICLGFQILSLALGAKTKKMKFGHHGGNHPVADTESEKRVYITSQNHGFEVDEASLPESVEVSYRSLFDGSLQGIRSKEKPAFGFQGHPEASPGPHDIETLFLEFTQAMRAGKALA